MRVLAVDPGYDRLGVAVMEHDGEREHLLHSSCIETDKQTSLLGRLQVIGTQFSHLLKEFQPTVVAIETLFFNQNQKTAIGVAQARGIIIYLAMASGATVREFGPQEVKVAVTGYGKSDKRAVFDMISRLIKNVPTHALDDEYDAIAIAITCLACHHD